MKKLFFLLFALSIMGCAKQPAPIHFNGAPDCSRLFVLLPHNYIIDLAAESQIYLNPGVHEFIVFCSAVEAREARKKAQAGKLVARADDWLVFTLEGTPADLADYCHNKALCLKNSARVTDWLRDDED